MAGVFRTGYQAIADAVWSLVAVGSRTVTAAGGSIATVTGNVNGSVGSVTGAVGSVTGSVGGNVTGSVGSVTGSVGGNLNGGVLGNIAGSVGGNVNGSVGSVAGAVVGPVVGAMKSIQHGTISIGTNETSHSSVISSVDVSKSELKPLGNDHSSDSNNSNFYRLYFSSATLVTAIRNLDQGGAMPAGTIGYTVKEHW